MQGYILTFSRLEREKFHSSRSLTQGTRIFVCMVSRRGDVFLKKINGYQNTKKEYT